MSGYTARTQSYLLQNEFQDGQSPGSIVPARVRDLIGSMPMPNIVQAPFRPEFPPYNAKFDGSTNDTAAWTAMFADITSRGYGEIKMPCGTSLVNPNTLAVPANVYWRGQGRYASYICRNGSTAGTLLTAGGPNGGSSAGNNVFQDFTINGNSMATSGVLLKLYYANECFTERVQFLNTQDAGLQCVQVWDSVFSETQWLNCASNTSASAYTTTDEGGGTTVGSEALQILSASAASGYGSSTDSNNQLRFVNCLIEGFCCGAIVVAMTSYNLTGASNIEFFNSKIEVGTGSGLTGKYLVALSNGTQSTRLENTWLAMTNNSGANVGTQQGMLISSGPGILVRNTVAFCSVSGFQSYIKAVGSNNNFIVDTLTEVSSTAPSQAMLWVTGNRPDWNDLNAYVSTNILVNGGYYPPRLPSQYIASLGINYASGAASPGGTLYASVPNTVYSCYTVSGGTYFQLDSGASAPQSRALTVINNSGSTINIKPPTGGTIGANSINTAVTIVNGAVRTFYSLTTLAWY